MAQNTVEDLRLTPADNGFKVCWGEYKKMAGGGQFGNREYESHEEVFKDNEESQAIGRFKDLKALMKKEQAEEKSESM